MREAVIYNEKQMKRMPGPMGHMQRSIDPTGQAQQTANIAPQSAGVAPHTLGVASQTLEPAADGPQDLLLRELQMRKARNKVRRRYVLMIIAAFLFSVALIYRYSIVIEINEHILREKTALAKLENENILTQKQIGEETDLEKIRLLAESKLDMQKPDKDQIVYIRVPRKDHALVAAPAKREGPDFENPFAYLLEQARLIQQRLISD